MTDSQKTKEAIVKQKNHMLTDDQDTNDADAEAEMPKEDNNITIQSRNISNGKQETNTTNNEQEEGSKAQTGTAEAKAPAKKASKNTTKAADPEGEREEGEEKEKNSEGKKIGGFIIGKTKGKGTFGKVKQGTHIVTGDKVAIKILEKDKIKDQSDIDRINREITILKKVRHPHVV